MNIDNITFRWVQRNGGWVINISDIPNDRKDDPWGYIREIGGDELILRIIDTRPMTICGT